MHRIRFRLVLPPDPAGGAYSAPPDSLARFNVAIRSSRHYARD